MSTPKDWKTEEFRILELVKNEPTFLNVWNVYKKIKALEINELAVPEKAKVRIALLSSFTVDTLAAYLDIGCRIAGLYPQIYLAPFNSYAQEILDKKSRLYTFKPDLIIFLVQPESFLGEDFVYSFFDLTNGEKRQIQTKTVSMLTDLVSTLASNQKGLIVASNFVVPAFSPLGILDNKVDMGIKPFFHELNASLTNSFAGSSQVYVMDLDGLASKHGKSKSVDSEMRYRGSIFLSESFLPLVAGECMSYIKALKNLTKKCIVLDLDNVLWGGVVGEDGFNGIKLGNDAEGKAFVYFQKIVLSFHKRGIILAINSKNNYEDAIRVIRDHPDMVLREKHFAAIRINWVDKVENIISIAKELNIGLDSMIFVDDSPQERERMKQALPQVCVLELPTSPFHYCETLENVNDFSSLVLTEEDKQRGELYYASRKRQELKSSKSSLEDYLKSLEIKAEIRLADGFSIPRIASLVSRTNQFNLTTRRYTQAEIERMYSQNDEFHVYSMRVEDKFGDEGIVGVAIVQMRKQEWLIDSFLLSCRVIGRKVETALLAKVIDDASKEGASVVIGEFIPTEKNELVNSFYCDHGFKFFEGNKEISWWKLDLSEGPVKTPEWVNVVYG